MPNSHFSSRNASAGPGRSPRLALLLACHLSLLAGCQGESASPRLSAEETRLVGELVDLHRLQILQDTNPALADSLRNSLKGVLDGPSLDARLRSLGDDPARGAVLLRAVRDSLAARRRELFGNASSPDGAEDADLPTDARRKTTALGDGDD